ncbi:MAG TPA: hypothetical protein DGT21_15470 [Armatimonadetes bacterium]|nr:hypothetical protein [Armatimonadota bacterium]
MTEDLIREVAVLGGGAGAKAVAADLAIQGCSVRLWDLPRFRGGLEPLRATPALMVSGMEQARAELALVTDELAEACRGVELICVVTQSLAHAEIGRALAGVVEPDQVVLVDPGSTGGALEMARELADAGAECRTIIETATLTHTARTVGSDGIMIRMRVGYVKAAALPGMHTQQLVSRLKRLFPGLQPARNVLETMLSNGNPVIHPAVMLLNAGTVERSGGRWEFYEEGFTPSVASVVEAVDRERLALGEALGLELISEPEMSLRQGYSGTDDYLTAYRDGPGFQGLGGPATMDHRYLTEDVACALVTMLELGDVCGVALPVSRSVMQLASVISGRDYAAESRRGLARLGLSGLSPEQILARVEEGPGACG